MKKNFNDASYQFITYDLFLILKSHTEDNEMYQNMIKDYLSLPESVQKIIASKFMEEFLQNKPVSISRFINITKEVLESYKSRKIDLNKLKEVELEQKSKMIYALTNEGPVPVEADKVTYSTLEAIKESSRKLQQHAKYNFDNTRFEE